METEFDVIVIGAGPAGAAAAVEAAARGLKVLVVDENAAGGGQVYRASAIGKEEKGPGKDLRRALAESGATVVFNRRCWLIEPGFRVHCTAPDRNELYHAPALIVAAGARERVVPVPGWTLPGVIGLAAATALIKAQKVLPGRRVVVAGRGPLLPYVAYMIVKNGGEVAALIDRNGPQDWLSKSLDVAARPGLALEGAGWIAALIRARVPSYFRSAVSRVRGDGEAEGVDIVGLDKNGNVRTQTKSIGCDAVCMGDGLAPSVEITQLLKADHVFDAVQGGWRVTADPWGRTSTANLYACGDGTGIKGAAAAPFAGRIAAIAAASDLGRLSKKDAEKAIASLSRQHDRASRFGAAMTALTAPDVRGLSLIGEDTVVCRCEGVTRRDIVSAVQRGAQSVNAIKSATRCGMGPCGARMCGDVTAALLSAEMNKPLAEIAPMTPRPPLKPVNLEPMMAEFSYSDIPMPEPAPL